MNTLTVHRCQCGRRRSRYSNECTKCHREHMNECYAKARDIVAKGVCPQCGSALRSNLAISGWWQCEQYGAVGFRKDSTRPSCSFQTFTE